MGRAKKEFLLHEFQLQGYVSRPEYTATLNISICSLTGQEITRKSISPSLMDSNDQVTAMEGQPTSGLQRDTLSTIPDHAKAGTRGTTELQQQSKSPLEPREEDISVQAADPVEDQLCHDAEYQSDKEGKILKRSPRGSILWSTDFWPAVFCQ